MFIREYRFKELTSGCYGFICMVRPGYPVPPPDISSGFARLQKHCSKSQVYTFMCVKLTPAPASLRVQVWPVF